MSIESDIFTFLKADTSLFTGAAGGIYGLMAPESVKVPFLVFNKVTTQWGSTLCGPDGIQRDVFQFDSYDKGYAGSLALAALLRGTLVGFKGVMGSTHVNDILFDNEIQMLDPEPGLYRVLTTLFIWHEVV
jgi:hypothetical protein